MKIKKNENRNKVFSFVWLVTLKKEKGNTMIPFRSTDFNMVGYLDTGIIKESSKK